MRTTDRLIRVVVSLARRWDAILGARRKRELARVAARRQREADDGYGAPQRWLRRSRDLHELERRQRMWERDELGDYRMTLW